MKQANLTILFNCKYKVVFFKGKEAIFLFLVNLFNVVKSIQLANEKRKKKFCTNKDMSFFLAKWEQNYAPNP